MTAWNWPDLRTSTVIWEDGAALVLNKPAGISVMGERHETDLVRAAQDAGEQLFPAHRIDKVTSGAVLFAKDLITHGGLTRQFNKRTVAKAYLVITKTAGLPRDGEIELPLSVGRKNSVRIAAPRESIRFDPDAHRWWVADEDLLDSRRYPSTTRFGALWSDGEYTVLIARPLTGRRHQIRVHLAWIGHAILGDPLFDRASGARAAEHSASEQRTCLHSWRLGFDADWLGGRRIDVEAEPGADFWAPLADRLAAASIAGLLDDARTR